VSWREDIIAHLPPPEDGRQAGLKQDIVDELADHLSCALQRELRKTGDDRAARRAVLDRFGSVKRIAYRLWFDAMKETIMNQRIAMITNAVLAAACIAVCVIAFLALRQSATLNAAILEKLGSLQMSASSPTSEVWANLTVDVREDRADGRPVADYEVALCGKAFNANDPEKLTARTDPAGQTSFGPVRPGRYELWMPAAEGGHLYRRVTLYPGQENTAQVITPIFTPQPAPAALVIDLPEDLREEGLWCWVWFDRYDAELGQATDKQEEYWIWQPLGALVTPDDEIADAGVVADPRQESYRESYRIDSPGQQPRECFEVDSQLVYDLSRVSFFIVDDQDEGLIRRVSAYTFPRRTDRRPAYATYSADSESANDDAAIWRLELPEDRLESLRRGLREFRSEYSSVDDP